jgi:hypothetical protein
MGRGYDSRDARAGGKKGGGLCAASMRNSHTQYNGHCNKRVRHRKLMIVTVQSCHSHLAETSENSSDRRHTVSRFTRQCQEVLPTEMCKSLGSRHSATLRQPRVEDASVPLTRTTFTATAHRSSELRKVPLGARRDHNLNDNATRCDVRM